MWDSGLRATPSRVLTIARELSRRERRQTELLPISQLATELGIHNSDQQSERDNYPLPFSVRSAFGRPIRRITRADAQTFRQQVYGRRRSAVQKCAPPLPTTPNDFDEQLRRLRRRLRMTQDELAQEIGAAGKADVYQWESRKRIPSPVFWQRIESLQLSSTTRPATH